MRLFKFIAILLVSMFAFNTQAQDEEVEQTHSIEILAKSNGNNIELRWAPSTKEAWLMGNVDGYVLERRKLDGKGWQLLSNVAPYTLEEWKSKTDTTDANNAIAAMCLLTKRQSPITDGGPFSQYLQASQEGNSKYAYALLAAEYSKEAATGLGLYYKDNDIQKGEIVQYRVSVKHIDLPYSADTVQIRVYTDQVYEAKKVSAVTAEPDDGSITIYWSRPLNNGHFSGYFIEKSIDNGKTFRRLNEQPYIKSNVEKETNNNFSYRDTNVVNYKPYQYQIVGITPFADESLPSDAVKTNGIDLTGPMPPSMVKVDEKNEPGQFEITWETTIIAPDHAGFYVGKSATVSGPFEKLNTKPLSKATKSFTDKSISEYSSIYYTVFAVDDKGNENMSAVAVGIKSDSIPPAQVVGLTGNVDSLGTVLLGWEMNTEDDLQGYRVYRGNRTNHEYIQLTSEPVPGNFFFDTISLRTLTKEIYYQVVAVDHHYNPSPYSEPLKIIKPDYIPPASPTINNYKMSSSGVALNWKVSASDDAVYQVLYRQKEGQDWTIVKEFENNSDTTYVDSNVEIDNFYTYTIVAIDEAGLYSERAKPAKIKVTDDGVRPGVSAVNGQFDKKCKCFVISWEFTSDKDYHFVLYRDEDASGLKALTTLEKNQFSYKDDNIYAFDGGYEYKVKVVYKEGGESLFSAPISFKSK